MPPYFRTLRVENRIDHRRSWWFAAAVRQHRFARSRRCGLVVV